MSGVEGAEREDYDEREAGVGRLRKSKGIYHEGHEGSRRASRTAGAFFSKLRVLCYFAG